MFYDATADGEPIRNAVHVIMGVALFDVLAGFANKKLGGMTRMDMITGNIGIEGLDPVYQAKFGEKLQSTVNGGRLGRAPFRSEFFQQVIGLNRLSVLN